MLIITLIIIINLAIPGETIDLGDIHRLTTDFSTLTTASSEWLEDTVCYIDCINRITKRAKHFMHLCGPAGTLVALGFVMAFSLINQRYDKMKCMIRE
uniref:Uncharacterized protein n=1 Tax=Meloidogyne incognita TaxID=6306 RepID=A0A914MEJ0_MELIC